MKKLLIQACSGRKHNIFGEVAALDLYDGVAFRVIKKFLKDNPEKKHDLIVLVLSAEFGLIHSDSKITYYDRRMDRERAVSSQSLVLQQFLPYMIDSNISEIFINVGKDYLPALQKISFPRGTLYAAGGIGDRNGQLKAWLNK